MRTNDLLALMTRAEQTLTGDNWHAEAVVVAEAAERLRVLANRLRLNGLSAEEYDHDPGRKPPTQLIESEAVAEGVGASAAPAGARPAREAR